VVQVCLAAAVVHLIEQRKQVAACQATIACSTVKPFNGIDRCCLIAPAKSGTQLPLQEHRVLMDKNNSNLTNCLLPLSLLPIMLWHCERPAVVIVSAQRQCHQNQTTQMMVVTW
jgi:hypothetical protein